MITYQLPQMLYILSLVVKPSLKMSPTYIGYYCLCAWYKTTCKDAHNALYTWTRHTSWTLQQLLCVDWEIHCAVGWLPYLVCPFLYFPFCLRWTFRADQMLSLMLQSITLAPLQCYFCNVAVFCKRKWMSSL